MPDVLIVGVSTRAAADSAAQAGYHVTALDAFGDLDQSPGVRGLSMPRDFGVAFTAAAAARAAATIECDAVAYLSNFENHPRAVRALASRGRTLLGNPPEVLRRIRDPVVLAETLERRGIPGPAVIPSGARNRSRPERGGSLSGRLRFLAPLGMTKALGNTKALRPTRWLVKPRRSGGGHGIRPWNPGDPIPHTHYVQERIDGVPGSIVFVTAHGRTTPLGLTRQIVGDPAFGSSGFRYCGNILVGSHEPEYDGRLARLAVTLASSVAEEFDLVGVNGIDFVARDGVPYPAEVNPRYSASMELVERAYGLSVVAAHTAACTSGDLPAAGLERMGRRSGTTGKSIVFARHDVVCGDTREWLEDPSVRDIPHPGERIHKGQPVCTVFADAADSDACYASLVRRASSLYETLDAWATVAV